MAFSTLVFMLIKIILSIAKKDKFCNGVDFFLFNDFATVDNI